MTFDPITERRLQDAIDAIREMREDEERRIAAGECIFFIPNPEAEERESLPEQG